MGELLSTASIAFSLAGIAATRTGRHGASALYLAVAAGLVVLRLVITGGSVIWAGANTAVFVWSLWRWWNGGGGDGTRRRLRRLAARFQGVRRTAPATT